MKKFVGPAVPAGSPHLNRQLADLDTQARQLTDQGQKAVVVQVPGDDSFRIRVTAPSDS
ncbi:hypothetical protein ACFU0X_10235 [Streptomyces cellulosae]|uniref:Uncharacterized protein n=1 Tax=Streptomyces cellulosae TaxID=1968 RepID=A0ABW6JDH5_STRCE